ncbi:hypothetical protein BGZ61DRAFT_166555 [Ilyonectria robusta]|uniref:uncharacterized protein n=1 Tax=Ilyonectria robusta TaxID=1079257 RepID=UPI001E8D48AD|nr:uncharacterized protein BGZ61DRAFT_166555 [Ilyonectria robusta]KAH8733829.1 hypothetical protein BGZ61DRAFT_166555 [Ilyonectria robusta]
MGMDVGGMNVGGMDMGKYCRWHGIKMPYGNGRIWARWACMAMLGDDGTGVTLVLKIGGFVGDAVMGLTACGGTSRGVGRQDEVAKRGQHSNEVGLAWMNCASIIRSFVTATSKTIQPPIFYVSSVGELVHPPHSQPYLCQRQEVSHNKGKEPPKR